MERNFFSHWFAGFEQALVALDDADRSRLLTRCGRACSDSYTRQVYLEQRALSGSLEEFLSRLQRSFPEIGFQRIDHNMIELTYKYCACDLVRNGYVQTPLLCECSKCSLEYNWSAAWAPQTVKVALLQSILGGGDVCKFRIELIPAVSADDGNEATRRGL